MHGVKCLPVLEKYRTFLESKSSKKVEKSASNAVESLVTDIGEREKITIIEIGNKELTHPEVTKIMNSLQGIYEPVNISLVLPED